MTRQRPVPVVLQTSLADCGAACLTMLLGYYGCTATLPEVRGQLGVSRDGLTALALINLGRRYGMQGRGFSLAPADLARVAPAIVHWQFNHFIVLQRWSSNSVEIIDPTAGRRKMTCREFDDGFTGVAIVFEPGPQFQSRRAARERHSWRRRFLHSVLLRHRGLWAQVLVASLAMQLLGLTLPVVTEIVVDHVLRARAETLLSILGIALILTVLSQFVLGYLRNSVLVSLRARADSELTKHVVGHLLDLPFCFFAQRGAADLVMRAGSVAVIRETVTGNVLPTLLDGPLALGYLVLVFVRDPVLGGFLAGTAVLQIAILLGTRRRVSALAQRELVAQSAAQGYLIEAIKGIETLKAEGAEAQARDHWSQLFVTQLNRTLQAGQTLGLIDATLGSVRLIAPVGLIWIGAWRVIDGTLSLGGMLALTAIAAAALTPLASLASSLQLLQTAGAHLARLNDIMVAKPERVGASTAAMSPLRGGIEVRDVSFRYSPQAPWILRDISIAVAPGQKVALVGRSGSGKSTLARILLCLHAPTKGQVWYDGIPAEDMDPRSLRGQVGVVTQEPALFTGTIRENISLCGPGTPMAQVEEAARLACIHEEIAQLPMRYETILSEGDGLSGGQRQRVALARALLTHPKVLLLDEATSHLDTVTEAAIETSLSGLLQTRILIAHRLSTIRDADVILVLDHGRVAERGTHEELLALGSHYAQLVTHQTVP